MQAGKHQYQNTEAQEKSSEAWDTNLTSSDNLTISSPDNVYITSNETINNLTVSSGSFLTIEKGSSLIISGNLSSSGTTTPI
ncbi:MAG: hypothetical protein CM15mP36_02060 [Flavobacteriales bacterium]|nr:MAG: hypothetical protein CM15mP36_02060 [Flavobacteriales bacterium]